jgi:tRNA (guanine37-N1)-methyltransferase
MFDVLRRYGIVGRAQSNNLFQLDAINPRDYTTDNYHRIDDKSFGGGPGMVMMIEPLEKVLENAKLSHAKQGINHSKVIYLSPQGQKITQSLVNQLALEQGLIMVCGRYEGVDERFIERNVDLELSVGDFVVSGGELPAQLLIDAIARQMPGALNTSESALNDSFMDGLLDYPHYTQPRDYNGNSVPEVLLSGNHSLIKKWRLQQSLWRTYQRRPDLLENREFTKEESRLLQEILEKSK